jgi:hypothetical protein
VVVVVGVVLGGVGAVGGRVCWRVEVIVVGVGFMVEVLFLVDDLICVVEEEEDEGQIPAVVTVLVFVTVVA